MAKNQKANACARGCKAAAGHSLLLLIWDSVGQSKEFLITSLKFLFQSCTHTDSYREMYYIQIYMHTHSWL